MEPIETVAAGYDRLANKWDRWTATVEPDLRLEFLRQLETEIPVGAAVVELGCGTGHPVGCALSKRFDYLGVDVSPEMVRIASAHCPQARFQTVNMATLTLPEQSLAAVVAFYSIIHLPRDSHSPLFASIHRWLEPRGWFVASLGTSDLEAGTDKGWLGAGEMYWSGWDADKNLMLLQDAGFSVVDAHVIGQMEGDNPVEFQWVQCQKAHAQSAD
ncbi:MAG: class I SAM-dependent methyltransferase [bacterium]|nr:class I SAM-dependent methyltransferase [bacterium]